MYEVRLQAKSRSPPPLRSAPSESRQVEAHSRCPPSGGGEPAEWHETARTPLIAGGVCAALALVLALAAVLIWR